jgi:hypothetical protein
MSISQVSTRIRRAADEEDLLMKRRLSGSSAFRVVALAMVASIVLSALIVPRAFVRAQDDELTGDFTVAINSEEIPTDVANAEMVVGRWRVSFANGTYEAERLDLGVLIQGSYEIDGESVTITDESGIVACSNAAAAADGETDVSTATYTFERDGNALALTPEEEGCGLRRILLSSKEFQVFVACLTSASAATAEASPAPVETDEEFAETPEPKGASPLDVLAIDATPKPGDDDEDVESGDLESEIDGLLGQLTACWATGDPDRFLPLWSEEFRDAFLSGDEDENNAAIGSLRAAMQVPITWERAGDVELTDDDTAEAVVRTTTLDEEEFVRYLFVFEDGAWRWDGAAA